MVYKSSSLSVFSVAFFHPNDINNYLPTSPQLPTLLYHSQYTMTDPSRTSKPLAILALGGGGLQAISMLMTLDKVLKKVDEKSGVSGSRKSRPCDVFDTIVGIGIGGWLAILLGRFRMDISACLSEWYNILQLIAPQSKTEELRLRLLQHCCFDTHRLITEVDSLTQIYGTGHRLAEPDTTGARIRHVFVAALASDSKCYKVFRTYGIPISAKQPEKLLEGAVDPGSFTISRAFEATATAKHFTKPWKAQTTSSGQTGSSSITGSPNHHDITELALDEMWGIYGTDVPLSVVVKIGPGLPSDAGVRQDDIDNAIKNMLNSVQPGYADFYYCLAPTEAFQDAAQNDFSTSDVASNAIDGYLNEPRVEATIERLAKRIRNPIGNR